MFSYMFSCVLFLIEKAYMILKNCFSFIIRKNFIMMSVGFLLSFDKLT